MYARSTALGILSVIALNLPAHRAPRFTLDTTGAGPAGRGRPRGAVRDDHRRRLFRAHRLARRHRQEQRTPAQDAGCQPAGPGRYPIRSSWDDRAAETAFHAFFAAGSPEHPLGWFHGESGTVTITRADDGQLSGSFEILARGFLRRRPAESRWSGDRQLRRRKATAPRRRSPRRGRRQTQQARSAPRHEHSPRRPAAQNKEAANVLDREKCGACRSCRPGPRC